MIDELAQLIAEQAHDMQYGHRVNFTGMPSLDAVGGDVSFIKPKPKFKQPLSAEDPRHGTLNGYNNRGCRCRPCMDANAEYQRDYQARKRKGLEAQQKRNEELERLTGY